MLRFEPVLLQYRPDWVVVVGDVNSTLACALVASKLAIGVAHVESGLRSLDRTMPDEINRLLTDQIADLLFTSSADADENLRREGIPTRRGREGRALVCVWGRWQPLCSAEGSAGEERTVRLFEGSVGSKRFHILPDVWARRTPDPMVHSLW